MPGEAHRLLDRIGPIPAYLLDEQQPIVAWNDAAVALIMDFGLLPVEERNIVRTVHPGVRRPLVGAGRRGG
ncbi:MmyB family transcriptional regulator [Streptomyces niphimycinicus]|uniref:MmyB family transcriptional regulator n=1 Tax=Streptomyces niphimycinicus TaxID=2842201 RepID=UPI0027E450D2|nr:hypothetical protein [Streptomyces niphimycinicus]